MPTTPTPASCRHQRLLEPPHHLVPRLLVVFAGVRGSGKTAQLSRLRASQRSSGLFSPTPLFVEMPRDLDCVEAVNRRAAAVAARTAGMPVFAERWHPDDGVPDVTMLSVVSFTETGESCSPPADTSSHVIVTTPGFESLVTLQLFDVLTRRGLMAGCPCGLRA